MQFLQKHHSKVARVVIFGLLTFITCLQVMAQKPILPAIPTSCDYATAPANIMLSVGAEPIGFSKNYLLVDMVSGTIVKTNASAPTFSSVGQGIYYVVTAYYTSGASIHNDIAGKLISNVYIDGLIDGCLKYSNAVGIKICATTCDLNSVPGTLSFMASPSPMVGVNTSYALVDDATNKIIQTSASASFSAVPAGDFSIVGVYSMGTFTLAVGDTLYAKTTNDVNCVGVSNTLHYKVCTTVCLAGTAAPAITLTTATNTCPTAIVNIATLVNTGIKPTGTSLIWSTHKLPTSMGDSLTDLTAISTSGMYYALYFDKINNCYSPADSILIDVNNCEAVGILYPNLTKLAQQPVVGLSSPVDLLVTVDVTKTGKFTPVLVDGSGMSLPMGTTSISTTQLGMQEMTIPMQYDGSPYATLAYTVGAPSNSGTLYLGCGVGTAAPLLSTSTIANICPALTINLTAITASNKPTNVTLTWHSGTPATNSNRIVNVSSLIEGTYFAAFYDSTNACFSTNTTPVTLIENGCAVGTINCAKTQIIPAPVVGTPKQLTMVVTVNVTTVGMFKPISVSGSGMSIANGMNSLSTTQSGIQNFIIPIKYDGSALGTFNTTINGAGTCSASLTTPPTKAILDTWTLDCFPTVGPGVK